MLLCDDEFGPVWCKTSVSHPDFSQKHPSCSYVGPALDEEDEASDSHRVATLVARIHEVSLATEKLLEATALALKGNMRQALTAYRTFFGVSSKLGKKGFSNEQATCMAAELRLCSIF
eukprot:233677-Pelagomonas_calceolata.AAC.5